MRRLAWILLGWAIALQAVAAGVTVTDFRGREVHLDAPARRIVALSPHLVENLFTAGAGNAIVGTVAHSDYPPAARDLPRVGGYNNVSLEAIIALKPDLVVAWASGQGGTPAMVARFQALGIPVYVDKPRRLDDIARAIEDLGHLAGTDAQADAAAARFRRRLARLRARYSDRPPVTLLYQVWDEPLQTLGADHFISHVIQLCGGRNVFADAASLAPKISIEAVLARDPQAIIASGMGDERPDWLDDWKNWPGLQAVRNGHLYFIPPDLLQRPSVRILDGAGRLCRELEAARAD